MRDYIRYLRTDNDFTQKQTAKAVWLTTSKYGYIARGIREPGKEILIALSGFYGMSIDYILGRTDVKEPYPKSRGIIL